MSDLFGNHIVGFPTRWLNYNAYQNAFIICQFLLTWLPFDQDSFIDYGSLWLNSYMMYFRIL